MRFNIPVTYSNTVVNISKCSANLQIEKRKDYQNQQSDIHWFYIWIYELSFSYYVEMYLVRIKFNIYHRHSLIHFVVVSDHPTSSLRNILKHQVKIKLIFFSRREEAMLQIYNNRVVQRRMVCNSRFLYLLSWRTFYMATVSPVSKHFAYHSKSMNNKSKFSLH